jgi:hypothetical protein
LARASFQERAQLTDEAVWATRRRNERMRLLWKRGQYRKRTHSD